VLRRARAGAELVQLQERFAHDASGALVVGRRFDDQLQSSC
jgi:hypothetical protein